MLFAHSVCGPTHPKGQRSHPERLGVVAAVYSAEIEEPVFGDPEAGDKFRIETIPQLDGRERVITGRDRRVCCENAKFANRVNSIVKGCGRILGEKLACELEREKRGMSLVQVVHRWRQTQSSKKAYAADAENFFLDDTSLGAASVQMAGDQAVDLSVLRHVRVEEVWRDPSDSCEP